MHFAADRMARPMYKRIAEAMTLDYRTRSAIGLAAADWLTGSDSALHQIHCSVARIRDNLENTRVLGGNLVAGEDDPGEISVDTVRRSLLGPQIEQDKVTAPNRAIVFLRSGRSAGRRYAR